jgi:hypothetical protein
VVTDLIQTIARAIYQSHWVDDTFPEAGIEHGLAIQSANAAIRALHDSGYAIVPREADRHLMTAGQELSCFTCEDAEAQRIARRLNVAAIYNAMIRAATTTGKAG